MPPLAGNLSLMGKNAARVVASMLMCNCSMQRTCTACLNLTSGVRVVLGAASKNLSSQAIKAPSAQLQLLMLLATHCLKATQLLF